MALTIRETAGRKRRQWAADLLAGLTPRQRVLLAKLLQTCRAAAMDFCEERGFPRGTIRALFLDGRPDHA